MIKKANTLYVNDIKFNGNSINRIYNNGDVYWGGYTPPSILPSGYIQLDYITNTGSTSTQYKRMSYIDTGYYTNNNTSIEFKFVLPYPRTYKNHYGHITLFGGGNATPLSTLNHHDQTFGMYLGRSGQTTFFAQRYTNLSYGQVPEVAGNSNINYTSNEYTFEGTITGNSVNVKCNGSNYAVGSSSFYSTVPSNYDNDYKQYPLLLFSCVWEPRLYDRSSNYREPIAWMTMNMYYFKIYESGVLLHDYVPAYKQSTNEYGMYDIVAHEWYPSENSSYPFTGPQIQ